MLRRALSSVTRTLALQRRSWSASNARGTGLVRGVRGGRVEALSGARLAPVGGGVDEAQRMGKLGSVRMYTRDIHTVRMRASKHDPGPSEGAYFTALHHLGFRMHDPPRKRQRGLMMSDARPFAMLDRRTANECRNHTDPPPRGERQGRGASGSLSATTAPPPTMS